MMIKVNWLSVEGAGKHDKRHHGTRYRKPPPELSFRTELNMGLICLEALRRLTY